MFGYGKEQRRAQVRGSGARQRLAASMLGLGGTIWLAAGLILPTGAAYADARDSQGQEDSTGFSAPAAIEAVGVVEADWLLPPAALVTDQVEPDHAATSSGLKPLPLTADRESPAVAFPHIEAVEDAPAGPTAFPAVEQPASLQFWQPDPATALDLLKPMELAAEEGKEPDAAVPLKDAVRNAVPPSVGDGIGAAMGDALGDRAGEPASVSPQVVLPQPQEQSNVELGNANPSESPDWQDATSSAANLLPVQPAATSSHWNNIVPQVVLPASRGLAPSIPAGYVQLTGGIYVPQSFVQADLAFRQAREARYQAWAAYQQHLHQQSSMVAALLPTHLWSAETGYPYADAVAYRTDAGAAAQTLLHQSFQDMVNLTITPDLFPIYPLPQPVTLTSGYGWRTHPIFGDQRFHSGVDLAAPTGTPVLATLSGVVETTGAMGGYGKTIILRHYNGQVETLYAHLSGIVVESGEAVRQGQVIGYVGSTGNSTDPHLHYEILLPDAQGNFTAIDNTELVQFAAQMLAQGHASWTPTVQPVAAYSPQAGLSNHNPFAAPFFDPNLYLPQPQSQGIEIRVGVELDVASYRVGAQAPLVLTLGDGQQIGTLPPGSYDVVRSGAGVRVGSQGFTGPVFIQSTNGLTQINGRSYRGRVLAAARSQGGVSAINWVDIEEYLWGVVGHEVYPSWDSDALMAQAVAARSYAMYYRYNPVSPDWYDIGDDTYYQAYGGTAKEFATTTAAVNTTAGQVLMQGGEVLQAMYAATVEISREAHGGRGMVQWGAADKAAAGWNYRSILAYYYPGTALGQLN